MTPSHLNSKTLRLTAALLALAILPLSGALRAERPMSVDDAGTLDQGGAKVEFGLSKDDRMNGFDGAVGYGPIRTLEVEFNFAALRDGRVSPRDTIQGYGAAIKWVPLVAETGLSAGLKYEYGHEHVDGGYSTNTQALLGLASWTFEAGPVVHLNLGWEWSRAGDEREHAGIWGIGLDCPLTEAFHVTVETFGTQHAKPDKALGLRYEIVEGLKISAAYGYGNDRDFGNLGVAWEF